LLGFQQKQFQRSGPKDDVCDRQGHFFETQPIKAHFARAEVAKPTEVGNSLKAAADLAGLPKVRQLAPDASEHPGSAAAVLPATFTPS
jgi:hypothetical protein